MIYRGNQDESVSDILKFTRNQQIDLDDLLDLDLPSEPLRELMDPELVFLGSVANDDTTVITDQLVVPEMEIELELPEVQTEIIICGDGLPADDHSEQGEFWEICSDYSQSDDQTNDLYSNSISSGSCRTYQSVSGDSVLSDSDVSLLTDLANATILPCEDNNTHDFDNVFKEEPGLEYGTYQPNNGSLLKASLRSRIQSKRAEQGLSALKVEFKQPTPEQLTEDEKARRVDRRGRNRMAAQKCRNKKRAKCSVLEDETRRLERRQSRLNKEVEKLRGERDGLRDIITIHRSVCPMMPEPNVHEH